MFPFAPAAVAGSASLMVASISTMYSVAGDLNDFLNKHIPAARPPSSKSP